MTVEALAILNERISIDPAEDLEAQLAKLPAKWAVYLMCDARDEPVQLLCVKNLRASLKRRLGENSQELSKKVNYREVVRAIRYRRVDSALEADWIYYESARENFPRTYRQLLSQRQVCFIHVDPDAEFPRFVKDTELNRKDGIYLGPLEDKTQAQKLIELLEDSFDLCRYYNILTQAPNGRPCAYKEMGKCPAPCDGSISMPQYRRMIAWAASVAADPAEMIREQQGRMTSAAAEMRFEIAAKIKAYIAQLSKLGKGPFAHVGLLSDFCYVSVQRGPRSHLAKIFLITPGHIEHVASACAQSDRPSELLRLILESCETAPDLDAGGVERMGIIAGHLFGKKSDNPLIPVRDIDEKRLIKALRDCGKQVVEVETEEEGVVKEMTSV